MKHDYLLQTVAPWIETLLDAGYRVLIYNGQLDVIIPYPATEDFVNALQWKHAAEYKIAPRGVWRFGYDNYRDGVVAGYAREVGNFTQLMVRNAGHILPYDQPEWALDLITRFVHGKSFQDT